MSQLKQFLVLLLLLVLLVLGLLYIQASHSTVMRDGVLSCLWTKKCTARFFSNQSRTLLYGLQQAPNTSKSFKHTRQEPSKSLSFKVHPNDPCDVSNLTLQTWKRHRITELRPRIPVVCSKLQNSDKVVKKFVKREMSNWTSLESQKEWYKRLLSSCDSVRKEFNEASLYNSKEEINFPIAYIFVVYTSPRQILRLLKAIYRPQNLYCIHPDAKQAFTFINLFKHLSRCLPNVFVASKLERVYYTHHSLMDAQMNCMRDLLAYEETRWKYIINICGRELPLKTNRETVEILSELNGKTLFERVQLVQLQGNESRWKNRFTWKLIVNNATGRAVKSRVRMPSPPKDLSVYKSPTFLAATREFIDFLLNDPASRNIYDYFKDCEMPEEHFYATVFQHGVNLANSSIKGKVVVNKHKIEQVLWNGTKASALCEGGFVHKICIATSADLDIVFQYGVNNKGQTYFFFNKYFMENDHVVMDCMEEHLINRNIQEYKKDCKHTL